MPDGEGRPGGAFYMYNGAQHNDVSSIAYDPASQPTTLNTNCAGSTCYPISYSYDQNTGRMSSYGVALTGGTISGTLTWNPNGSLGKLVIADPFNLANAQTCNYTADDLSRLASVNCGSVWAQTFSYDPFGNITKSGSVSWMPGYSSSTNHYTLAGTSYDANGNVLNDTFNSYTWDAEGKNVTTILSGQTWTSTNDAFGHLAELAVNGTYSKSYLTIGKFKLSAIGQTPYYSEYPLPGGSVISQGGGATGTQMADWLGTIRAYFAGGTAGHYGAHAPFGEAYAYPGGYPQGFAGNGGIGGGEQGDGNMTNTTYWFPERRYRSSQGRWLTPDPAGLDAVDPSNPQSWNRYAYVMNNPLSATDPEGLWCVWEDGTHDDDPKDGGFIQDQCEGAGGHWDPSDTIAGIFQEDGVITKIRYASGLTCTTADCGVVGETLDAFDKGLQSYSVVGLDPKSLLFPSPTDLGDRLGNIHVEWGYPKVTWKQWFHAAADCAFSPDPLPKTMKAQNPPPSDYSDRLEGNSLNRSNTIYMKNKRGRAGPVTGTSSPGLDATADAAGLELSWAGCMDQELGP